MTEEFFKGPGAVSILVHIISQNIPKISLRSNGKDDCGGSLVTDQALVKKLASVFEPERNIFRDGSRRGLCNRDLIGPTCPIVFF